MPTYEYECSGCGHKFDKMTSFQKTKPIIRCPSCKKRTAKRLISGGCGLIFKGPGFYVNDYPKDKP